MPKNSADKLFLLIDRLSKAEKRSFRLYVNRNAAATDSKFMQLFDVLSKEGALTDPLLLKKIPTIKKAQLSNLKANLYRQLLTSLRLSGRKKFIDIEIREQIDFARILYSKGLYRQCLELLAKAKQLAVNNSFESLALTVLYFEKRIESQHVTGSMSKRAQELSDESDQLLQQIKLTNQLSNASLLLYGRYLNHGYIKNEEEFADLSQFVQQLLPEKEEADWGFFQRLYFYQSQVWFHNMAQHFPQTYRYAKKWAALFDESPSRKETATALFLKANHNLLNALFMCEDEIRFNERLIEFNAFEEQLVSNTTLYSVNEVSVFHCIRCIHFLNKLFLEADYQQSDELEMLRELIESNPHGWDQHRIMVFHYKLASVYYGIGDKERALHFLNIITNKPTEGFREDIQCFAQLLSLIIHYELGNQDLVSSKLRSFYRFLLRMRDLGAVQKAIIRFLRKVERMRSSEIRASFISLRNELEAIQQRPYEKRPFLYLDIISWLNAKLEGVTMAEVLRAKKG